MTPSTRLRLLYAARMVSMLGSSLTALALPWLVLTTTGSATRTGVVFAAEVIGSAVLGLPGGAFVERLGPRRAMLAIDAVAIPLLCVIPVAAAPELLTFPLVLVIAFLLEASTPAYLAATNTALPMLVGEDETRLSTASGHLGVVTQLGGLAGTAVAGVAMATLGVTNVLYLDAATYAGSFLLLAAALPARGRDRARHTPAGTDPTSGPGVGGGDPQTGGSEPETDGADRGTGGIGQGLRFLWTHPLTRASLGAIALLNLAFNVAFVAIPVTVARSGHSADWYGWIMAAFGAGAVAGGLLAGPLTARFSATRLACAGAVAMATPLWLPAVAPTVEVLLLTLAVVGIANALVNAPAFAVLTAATPPALRPKMFAALMTVSTVVMPVGALLAGPLLDRFGPGPTFLTAAALVSIGTAWLVPVWWRAPRTWDDTTVSEGATVAQDAPVTQDAAVTEGASVTATQDDPA